MEPIIAYSSTLDVYYIRVFQKCDKHVVIIDYIGRPSTYVDKNNILKKVYHVYDAIVTDNGNVVRFRTIEAEKKLAIMNGESFANQLELFVHSTYKTLVVPMILRNNLNIWFVPYTMWQIVTG